MDTKLDKWRALSARLAAEFGIVVLGVTIALWADGWVSDRDDRADEFRRLEALQDNVTDTLSGLDLAIENAAGAAAALQNLSSVQTGEYSSDQLKNLLRNGLLYGTDFYPELNVYQDLKSSGELALLTNRILRQSLAKMDARLELVDLARADMSTVQQLNVDPYMIENLDLRTFYSAMLDLEEDGDMAALDLEFLADRNFQCKYRVNIRCKSTDS